MDVDEVLDDVVAEESTAEAAAPQDLDPGEEESPEDGADTEARRGIDDFDEALFEPPEGLADSVQTVMMSDILGVPLNWERPIGPQGPRPFPVAPSFIPFVEAVVRQVRERAPAPWGELQKISTAGLFVGKELWHGKGRAMDFDRLVFENVQIAPRDRDHESPSLAKRRRYWAFAALCRSNASYVLHGRFDSDHRDHVHYDNGGSLAFTTSSEATVKLVQAVLNDIFGHTPKLDIDGGFGRNTKDAAEAAVDRLGLPGDFTNLDTWKKFLRRSCRLGFTLAKNP